MASKGFLDGQLMRLFQRVALCIKSLAHQWEAFQVIDENPSGHSSFRTNEIVASLNMNDYRKRMVSTSLNSLEDSLVK